MTGYLSGLDGAGLCPLSGSDFDAIDAAETTRRRLDYMKTMEGVSSPGRPGCELNRIAVQRMATRLPPHLGLPWVPCLSEEATKEAEGSVAPSRTRVKGFRLLTLLPSQGVEDEGPVGREELLGRVASLMGTQELFAVIVRRDEG